MRVYVVTSGEYSDYRINGVFSTEEKANEYVGNAPNDVFTIEEFEADSEPPQVFRRVWKTHLKLDGSEYYSSQTDQNVTFNERMGTTERGFGETDARFERGPSDPYFKKSWLFRGTSFISKEHAHKLAVEQRQKAMREHPEFFN